MVGASLDKGNIPKVPDVPRQWPMPARQITFKNFKALLRRRSRALCGVLTPHLGPNPWEKREEAGGGVRLEGAAVEAPAKLESALPGEKEVHVVKEGGKEEKKEEERADEDAVNPNSKMQIVVKSLTRNIINLVVQSSDTIGSVKAKIPEEWGVHLGRRRQFLADGKELEDARTLADCNIQEESALFLVSTLWD